MPRLVLLFLLVLFNTSVKANHDTLLIGPYAGYTPPYLLWRTVEHANESYSDAIQKLKEGKFERWGKHMAFTQGVTNRAYWVIIKLRDTLSTTRKFLWSFYHTSCKYEFYELDSSLQLINRFTSSTNVPLRERPYPVRSISFPFLIGGGETKTLLLKTQSTNTDVLYLDQDIATPEEYLQWEINYTGLLNRYFGFFIFALLVNLLLFVFMRNKIYGWLSAYILFLLVYNIHDFSFDALTFPSWFFEKFVLIPKFAWIIGATFSSLIIFNLFTNQQKRFPKWFKVSLSVIRILQVLMLLCVLSHFWVKDHQDPILVAGRFISYVILAGAMAFQIINLFYLSIKKQRAGLFFLVSSGPLIACAFVYFYYLLTSRGVFVIWPSNVINACGFEVILLTIIFTYDYRNKNNDRNRLLEESLAAERKTTSAILKTQEEERKRIAEDLHDELGSSLAALKMRLQKTDLKQPLLDEIITVVDKASSDARNISHNLMPPEFEKTSLDDLLSNYYARLSSESFVRFHFHTSGSSNRVSKEDELVIYRIIMELTGNIIKHSGATEATIQIIYFENHLEIMVEDNGTGFASGNGDGIGWKNIQSRTNYLNGEIKVDSGAIGTTVMLQIPFKTK